MSAGHSGLITSSRAGLPLAAGLAAAWLLTLLSLLAIGAESLPAWAVVIAVLLRTQLQTGLFIIGHDAMHGVLWPARPRLNHRLGALALACYAALPYRRCRHNHQLHHSRQATDADPDFASRRHPGLLRWYGRFMAGYLNPLQMIGLLGGWAALAGLLQASQRSGLADVLLFCTLPLLLSSLQLFVVGTYLPHRRQRAPHGERQPRSLDLPAWLSLLACFHFGYHREHHDNPALAWHQLPAARRRHQIGRAHV